MSETPSNRRPSNRLGNASSPYLLQHAHNPVEWWEWGSEAFGEARRRGVPILLSVGYSTCYWCHVMERESFEDEATARVMNERFVCVKLDREERPDVDDIYMNALLVMRGTGGWPMNVMLEPEQLRPFWAGTYFPREARGGMPSWTQILEGISAAWSAQREVVLKQAEEIASAVRENLSQLAAPVAIGAEQVTAALQQLLSMFDRVNGGFGGAPKFPQPAYLEFLMQVVGVAGDEQTRDAITGCIKKTLDSMLAGGVYDQVGGGFHRYSVDATWTVPHFEKMLYDNAQLAKVYALASGLDETGEYARVARETLEYVLREMTSPEGGFFSAQDAEVDGREGLNYVWTAGQVAAALGDEADAALAKALYGLEGGPKFQDPHHPEDGPVNVLRLGDRLDRLAPKLNMGVEELRARRGELNARLLAVRGGRKQPRLDDKIIASWNGLMISAMAHGHRMLGDARYLRAAERAAQFILREMVDAATGRLARTWRAGKTGSAGFLEDSAMVIRGLVDLAELQRDRGGQPTEQAAANLRAAEKLAGHAVADFKETRANGSVRWCDTRAGESDLFVRTTSMHDGVMPSGVSAMLDALFGLGMATGSDRWLGEAQELIASISGAVAQSPAGCINATRVLAEILGQRGVADQAAARPSAGAVDSGSRGVASEPGASVIGGSGGGSVGSSVAGSGGRAAPGRSPVMSGSHERSMVAEVYAAVDRVQVGPDMPAEFGLLLRIPEGYHIPAADPGPGGEGLVPLRVGIVSGSGVVAYADYPAGEQWREGLRVYKGTVEFNVVLEFVGPWKGRPLVALTYQACTESECLMPVTVELDVAIDRAG
ncbi:MAG: hypothetical protein GIKADHBN_03448 [Phycisphaerales bacterium]|nr:hypothetical protein [Phycisphaerales bacterium]